MAGPEIAVERGSERGQDVGPGLRPGESIGKLPDDNRDRAERMSTMEYRGTLVEAIREVEARSGATAFVSADLASQGRARPMDPEALIASIERTTARIAPGGEPQRVYSIGEGGAIVNTVTGRTEYLPVHGQGAREELARGHEVSGPGAPGEGAVTKPEPLAVGAPPFDERLYAPRGGAPREVAGHSHYNEPIAHADGELAGNSRRWGDASHETQRACMDLIIAKGREHGMSDHEIALTLAIARVESGFNPDAAAGATSAAGLGQMINRTGAAYGLGDGNRWDADAQAEALVRHTQDNIAMARRNGHGDELDRFTYAYHHDGPSLAYGGQEIADRNVVPNIAMYEAYVRTQPVPAPDADRGTAPVVLDKPQVVVDERVYASKGYAYKTVVANSHYNEPISHPDGELSGNSRIYGDASRETQLACMELIVAKGREHGMTDHEIAVTLAIARVESGFNPDAAAGTTSAGGLGQFVDATGAAYGLDDGNRWNADAQAEALVRHTQDNMALARRNGHGDEVDRYTYAYHHDGPSLKFGGLGLADESVVPNIALYEEFVRTH